MVKLRSSSLNGLILFPSATFQINIIKLLNILKINKKILDHIHMSSLASKDANNITIDIHMLVSFLRCSNRPKIVKLQNEDIMI